jgi:hypothetical protein
VPLSAQSINSGTIIGTVKDPSGAIVSDAKIVLRNPVSGYEQSTHADSSGSYRFNNIPPNNYLVTADVPGFAITPQNVDVRSSLPVTVDISLQLHVDPTKLNVPASAALVESEPSAHQDVDRSAFMKLPILNPGNQLSQVITNSSGGVAADANGFFHPLGDHAQTSYMIDGQPISDQPE